MGWRNGNNTQEYLYDFSVDGGATSAAVVLSAKSGYAPLPQGAIVEMVCLKVITACTSGGSATVDVGNATDEDGYHVAIPVATLADEYCLRSGEVTYGVGALLWDNTNDNELLFLVNSANDATFQLDIDTAALTAGKVLWWVDYYMPSLD